MDSPKIFIRYFDKHLLREFICRTLTTLNDKIKQLFKDTPLFLKYPQFHLEPKFTTSQNYQNPPDIYLVINYKNGEDNFGHITFHLIHLDCNYETSNGPLHIVNNSSKRKRRQLVVENMSTQSCKRIRISIGKLAIPPHNISNEVTIVSNAIIDIFNKWFDLNDEDALIYTKCQLDIIQHRHKYNHIKLTNALLKEKVDEVLSWRSIKKTKGGRKLNTKITFKKSRNGSRYSNIYTRRSKSNTNRI